MRCSWVVWLGGSGVAYCRGAVKGHACSRPLWASRRTGVAVADADAAGGRSVAAVVGVLVLRWRSCGWSSGGMWLWKKWVGEEVGGGKWGAWWRLS